jgi:hypothetical protein
MFSDLRESLRRWREFPFSETSIKFYSQEKKWAQNKLVDSSQNLQHNMIEKTLSLKWNRDFLITFTGNTVLEQNN